MSRLNPPPPSGPTQTSSYSSSYSGSSTPIADQFKSSNPPLSPSSLSPSGPRRASLLLKQPPSSPSKSSTNASPAIYNMYNSQSPTGYSNAPSAFSGNGGPPPRPSRNNTTSLNDFVSTTQSDSRRESAQYSSGNHDPYSSSLNDADSPTPSALTGVRSRSGTVKGKKGGVLSFMSGTYSSAVQSHHIPSRITRLSQHVQATRDIHAV